MWYSSWCGCVFVPVGDGPGIFVFFTYHLTFDIELPRLISLLSCCFPVFFYRVRVLKIREPTKCSSRTGIPPYILLQCCTAVVAWSVGWWVGGGGARGLVERVVWFEGVFSCLWEMAMLFCSFLRITLISI